MSTTIRRNILLALLLALILALAVPIFLVLYPAIFKILFNSLGNSHTDFIFSVSRSDLRIAVLGLALLLVTAVLLLRRRLQR
jgi:hypothetical protein